MSASAGGLGAARGGAGGGSAARCSFYAVLCANPNNRGVYDGMKDLYELAGTSYDDSFVTFISEPFLTSAEEDALIEQLREAGFFDNFVYSAQAGDWVCMRCHVTDERQREEARGGDAPEQSTAAPTVDAVNGVAAGEQESQVDGAAAEDAVGGWVAGEIQEPTRVDSNSPTNVDAAASAAAPPAVDAKDSGIVDVQAKVEVKRGFWIFKKWKPAELKLKRSRGEEGRIRIAFDKVFLSDKVLLDEPANVITNAHDVDARVGGRPHLLCIVTRDGSVAVACPSAHERNQLRQSVLDVIMM